jgi:O-Antigen ligase
MTTGYITDHATDHGMRTEPPAVSNIARLQKAGALILLILVSFGYPLTALIVTFLRLDTQALSIPYRLAVMTLSIIVILSGLFTRFRGRLDFWLILFQTLYLFRLIYDYTNNSIIGNVEAIQFYVAVVLAPLLAINLGGGADFEEHVLAKLLIVAGAAATSMALLAQFLGLGYNPWEIYGTTDVRLGFEALNPISLGHVAATTALTSVYIMAGSALSLRWRMLALAGIVMSGVLLINAGSRGALLAFAISVSWFGLTKIKRLAVIGPVLTLALLLGASQTSVFQATVGSLTGGLASDASGRERLFAQAVAIEDFADSPVFGKHYINPDLGSGYYPHNLFIESAMATGIFGLALFLITSVRSLKNLFGNFTVIHPLLSLIFVQHLVGSFLSGALWGSDAFFIYTMIVLCAKSTNRYTLEQPVARNT